MKLDMRKGTGLYHQGKGEDETGVRLGLGMSDVGKDDSKSQQRCKALTASLGALAQF